MKTKKSMFGAVLVALLVVVPLHGAYYHTAQDLADGHLFAAEFPQVGIMSMLRSDGIWYGGSATLISDRWLLTAGHNLTNGGDPSQILEFRFRTGVDPFGPSGPDHFRLADEWYVHPGYIEGVATGVDLALVRLAEPITDVVPMSLYLEPPTIGMQFEVAGYGRPGSVETGMLPSDWMKRAGRNSVDSFSHGGYARSQLFGYLQGVELEWQSTPGDSGGPWLRAVDNALFGVNSYGVGGPDFGIGSWSGAQPIYPHLDWIFGTTGLPEPTTLLLVAVGLPLIRRRRSFC